MPTGASRFGRVEDQPGSYILEPEDCYFKIKLVDAQAFSSARLSARADFMLFSSAVESKLLPGAQHKSLYKFTTIENNTSFRLGSHTDLTDWLPAHAADTITMNLEYKVTRASPIKRLIDEIGKSDLASVLSPVSSAVAIGAKVAGIVGHILSFVAGEGGTKTIFEPMPIDFDVGSMKAGYYAIVGAMSDETLPSHLKITDSEPLRQLNGHDLTRYSYAVFKVEVRSRLGLAAFRETHWGALLKFSFDTALSALSSYPGKEQHNNIMWKWMANQELIGSLARADQSVLGSEVTQILQEAMSELQKQAPPVDVKESGGDKNYPDEWQKILGVSDQRRLHWLVADYHEQLAESERLQELYDQQGE